MIVEMKKATIALLNSRASENLLVLQDLGVLHPTHVKEPESKETETLKGKIALSQEAIRILSTTKKKEQGRENTSPTEVIDRVISLKEEWARNQDRLEIVDKELERLNPVGDFSSTDFENLKQEGLWAKIYRCPRKGFKKRNIGLPFEIVGRQGKSIYIFAVDRHDFSLPFDEIRIPDRGLNELKKEKEEIEVRNEKLTHEIAAYVPRIPDLKKRLVGLTEQLEFAEAVAGLGQEEQVAYLQGYCPIDQLDGLKQMAGDMGWGLMIEEPSEESEVPTLIKNPAWIRIVQPVFDFMGTVPGYREFDVSFWFLIALSLFFAMLVGDGGYGLLFLLATMIARMKLRSAPWAPFLLLAVFSTGTILWGLITGTWFGVEYLSTVPFLAQFIINELNSYTENQNFMIQLCFVLGGIHLTLAHVVRAMRYIKSLKVLGELGWICILWFLYFLARHFVLGKPLSDFSVQMLAIGILLASVFSNPQKNFIKSALLGLADLPLKVISSFSDLVSYLRLFAVGYATLVVAVSFNNMAADLGAGSLLGGIGAALILLLGHTVNIIMAGMAVLVHGIRLNMLEFSTHLGMNWSGRMYRPFKKMAEDGRDFRRLSY